MRWLTSFHRNFQTRFSWKLMASFVIVIVVGVVTLALAAESVVPTAFHRHMLLPVEPSTFQQIYREADRLHRLVSDLQELSRVEAGAFYLNRQPLQMNNLITQIADRLHPQFEEKNITLHLNLPARPSVPPVLADEDRLSQVLLNLMGNALQYTPDGGAVTITAKTQNRELLVNISDTGVGIPPEHLPHLFTRFYRVDKSRSRVGGGSSIGLTIVKHLVEAHGGHVWVESQGVGRGSTFGFGLPAGCEPDRHYCNIAETPHDHIHEKVEPPAD